VLHFSISYANGPNGLFLPSPAPHFDTVQVFLIYFPHLPSYSTTHRYVPTVALALNIISVCWWKGASVFWNANYVLAVLE